MALRRTSQPSQWDWISYIVIGAIGLVALVGLGFAIAAFVLVFARTGTCDEVPVCDLVRNLTKPIANLDLVVAANTARVTIVPDATPQGDGIVPTDPAFRQMCNGNSSVVLVRVTPSGVAPILNDAGYLWFGGVDVNGPILTSFPADGKLHAVTGTFSGIGNHPTAMFVFAENGREAQLEGFVYVDDCTPLIII